MVFHSCYTNLKGFAISRPPLVVFTLCLTALAIATLSLARVVSQSDSLPNPDVRLDWNLLLQRMAELELCILQDDSSNKASSTTVNSTIVEPNAEEDSVTALLGIDHEVHNYIHNNTMISGSLPASLLGLRGNRLLSVSFRVDVNASSAHLPSNVCATFTGPRSILPATRTPPSCNVQSSQTPSPGSSARLLARPQAPQMVDDWCEEGTILSLAYHSNPSLTVMLTLRDRSMVNLHLMHTSYFLLVMAMTLVCYALLRGKHNKTKTSGTNPTLEKVPLDP